jgi:hypothetical protein
VQAALDADEDMAAKNKKRQALVASELTKPGYPDKVHVVDMFMVPMEATINILLERTNKLNSLLRPDTNSADENEELGIHCKKSFLRVVSGGLGEKMVAMYMQQLKSYREFSVKLQRPDDYTLLAFQHTVFAASEMWRRFCYCFMSFPFCLFALVDTDLPTFLEKWHLLKGQQVHCAHCVDAEFAAVLFEMPSTKFSETLVASRIVFKT